jgi:hypothetical protein
VLRGGVDSDSESRKLQAGPGARHWQRAIGAGPLAGSSGLRPGPLARALTRRPARYGTAAPLGKKNKERAAPAELGPSPSPGQAPAAPAILIMIVEALLTIELPKWQRGLRLLISPG